MPSFPDAVKSFTAKASGNNIDPAHINDLQDEVNAIEGGILNGTARVVSSGLSVGAASTFAVRPVMPPPAAVRLTIGSSLTLADGTSTGINWLAQDYATNSSLHSSAANSSRVTPQSTGIYLATLQVRFEFNSSGRRDLDIQDSSNTSLGFVRVLPNSTATTCIGQVSATKRFDVTGGWLKAVVTQAAASTMSLSNDGNTWFEVRKL